MSETKRIVKRRTPASASITDLDVGEFDATEREIADYVSESESETDDFEVPETVTSSDRKEMNAKLKEIKWSPSPDPKYEKLPFPESDWSLDMKYLASKDASFGTDTF